MTFTQDQIAAIVGTKELEIISLRFQLNEVLAKLRQYEPSEEKGLKVVEVDGDR